MNKTNWTESPMQKYDWMSVSHKHRNQFGVMVNVPESLTSDLGSIPAQVSEFF